MTNSGVWDELTRLNNELSTAYREIEKSNASLRWLNEQKNELLGMAAHDLRNPLASVLSYVALIEAEPERLSDVQRRMLARIRSNTERMLEIVDDVVDFSAIESGIVRLDAVRCTARDLVDETMEAVEPLAARKGIRVEVQVAPDLPAVRADRRKIVQVLANLVSNAVKFSAAGTVVDVSASSGEEGRVLFSVRDRGVGMSEQDLARVFQPFASAGAQGTDGERGTGLGLAIVRRIVEAHGGRVKIDSRPGEGTAVSFTLAAEPR